MHACTAFFCLFCVSTTRSSAWRQSLRIEFPAISRATKNLKAIEAFLLLLLLAFLPAKQASAQTYPVVDSFSGSGALSSNWTNTIATGLGQVPLAQNSGAVGPSVSGQQGMAIYTGTTFANDQYAQATFVNHLAGGGATGVCVRMNVAGDGVCYLADWGRIYAMVDGAISYTIAEACPVPSSGDTIQIIAVGGSYTCNDVTAGTSSSGSDTNYSLGSPGIVIDQTISTAYALSHFQADCSPSCGLFSGPAAAAYPLTDSFSGSGALSSNWTSTLSNGYVALTQNSGTAGVSVAGQAGLAIYTGVTFSDDQYAQAVFVNQNSSNSATGVCVRMDSSGSGVCYLAGEGLIYALDEGAGVDGIASCPIPSAGDTIRLSVVGAVYTCEDVSTGASGTGAYWANTAGHPAIFVDQRQSSAYVLAQFQADCIPSCARYVHPPTIITLGSFSTTATNPGFNNAATTFVSGSSAVNNGSSATYNLSPGTAWHSPLNSSSYVSYDPGTGPLGSVVAPNGDYYYTTTFTIGSNVPLSSTSGTLAVLADDTVAVYLNGSLIQPSAGPIGDNNSYSHCSEWVPNCVTPITFNLTGLVTGQNVLTFDVKQVALHSEGLDYWGTIALNAPAGVTIGVTPTNATLYAGQTQQLTATVGNTNNNAVTWTLTPSGLGSISSAGLFTAPATIASQQTVIVTATSQADPTASASALLTMAVARPDLAVTANAGSSYEPGQTVTVAINAHNVGGADASSTNINIIAPDGTSSALPAFPLTVGQNAGKQAVYTVPAIPPPPAPQALPASTDSSLFNVNLIVNGNAEAAVGALNDQIAPSVPGWIRTGNFTTAVYGNCCGFPGPQDPGPSNRGSNFFYGGPDSASSSATQNIDVSSAAELVDSGFVKYNFSAWLGGYSTQSDNAVITAAFQDSNGNTISAATLGPVTEQDRGGLTGLLLRSTNGFLPPKTRTVTITIVMTRLQGSDNDGYADNFSFVLSGPSNSGTADADTANYLAALGAADNISLPFKPPGRMLQVEATGPKTLRLKLPKCCPSSAFLSTQVRPALRGATSDIPQPLPIPVMRQLQG